MPTISFEQLFSLQIGEKNMYLKLLEASVHDIPGRKYWVIQITQGPKADVIFEKTYKHKADVNTAYVNKLLGFVQDHISI